MDDTAIGQPGPGADENAEDKGDRAVEQERDGETPSGGTSDHRADDSPLDTAARGLEEGLESE